jgi:hypothetical protein
MNQDHDSHILDVHNALVHLQSKPEWSLRSGARGAIDARAVREAIRADQQNPTTLTRRQCNGLMWMHAT